VQAEPIDAPASVERLRAAARWLEELRRRQRDSGKDLRGRTRLGDASERRMAAVLGQSGLIRHTETPTVAFERLEEMARRRNQKFSGLEKAAYRLLACELAINAATFNAKQKEVFSTTLYNGELSHMPTDPCFESLRDTPGIFKRAATNNPKDPEGLLLGVLQKIEQLTADPRFESLRDSPGIFKCAAMNNPKDPEGLLLGVLQKIDQLTADPRFESLQDTPWVFKRAAIGNPKDPEGFLLGVLQKIDQLTADPRFESLQDTPGIFKYAATYNPKDPEELLEKFMRGEVKIGGWNPFMETGGEMPEEA